MADNNLIDIVIKITEEGIQDFKGAVDTLKEQIDEIVGSLFNMKTGLATLGFGAAAQQVVSVSSSFENLRSTLLAITKDSQQTDAALQWIGEFTARTPYELQEVSESFNTLTAYGFNAMKSLEPLGDVAAGMGKPLQQAVEALADAVRGEFERLKEFGINTKTVGDNVVLSWQENGQEMTQTVRKTATDMETAITGIFTSKFGGMMSSFSKTWKGMFSNLMDSFNLFQKAIGDAGFFDAAKNSLANLSKEIQRLSDNGDLKRWAEEISKVFTSSLNSVTNFAKQLYSLIGTALQAIQPFISAFISRFMDLGPSLIVITTGLMALSGVLGVFQMALGPVIGLLGTLSLKLTTMPFTVFFNHLQLSSQYIGVFQVATASLTTALGVLALAVSSAFIGLQIGRFIGELQIVKDAIQGVEKNYLKASETALKSNNDFIAASKKEGVQLTEIISQLKEKQAELKKEETAKRVVAAYTKDLSEEGRLAVQQEITGIQTVILAIGNKIKELEKEAGLKLKSSTWMQQVEKVEIESRKKIAEETIKTFESTQAVIKSGLEKEIANIESNEARGIDSKEKSAKAKVDAEIKANEEILKVAQDNYNATVLLTEDLSKAHQKALNEELKAKKNYNDAVSALEQGNLQNLSKLEIEKLDMNVKYTKMKLDEAKKASEETNNLSDEEKDKRKKALSEMEKAQAELEKSRVSAVKTAVDNIISLTEQEVSERKSKYSQLSADIELEESKGRISTEKASIEKKKIALEEANEILSIKKDAADKLKREQQSEGEEYKKLQNEILDATANTTKAEAELYKEKAVQRKKSEQDEAEAAKKANDEAAKAAEEAAKKTKDSMNDAWKSVQKTFQEKITVNIDTDPAKAALESLVAEFGSQLATAQASLFKANLYAQRDGFNMFSLTSIKQAQGQVNELSKMYKSASDSLSTYNNNIKITTKSASDLNNAVKESEKVFNKGINLNFKGTGSATLPLTEKIKEMSEKIKNFAIGVSSFKPVITATMANAGNSMNQLNNIKDLGKIDIQTGGKSYPVIGATTVLQQLANTLRREGLVVA